MTKQICRGCGQEFIQSDGPGRPRESCTECRPPQPKLPPMKEVTCVECGLSFLPGRRHAVPACPGECRDRYWKKRDQERTQKKLAEERQWRDVRAADYVGTVYLIRAAEVSRFKIGFSINVLDRLSTIQGDSPVKVELVATFAGSKSDERDLHQQFAPYRHHREWYEGEFAWALARDVFSEKAVAVDDQEGL